MRMKKLAVILSVSAILFSPVFCHAADPTVDDV
jgi:hypothetical protein